MAVQSEIGDALPCEQLRTNSAQQQELPDRRVHWLDLLILLTFAFVSSWVLGLDLWQVIAHGRVWTGSDGFFSVDQLQYEAWVRDASRHLLVSNLYVLHSTPAVYFQPAIVISGGLTALGVSPTVSLLLWKPVAILAVFFTTRAYVARTLEGRQARIAALALALLFGSFTYVYGRITVIGDLYPGFLAWGYPFALLGLAAMVAALLSYDRLRGRRRIGWLPGALGATASLMHPWNGVLLIAALLGGELLISGRRRIVASELTRSATIRQLAQPVATVALTGIPLAYYVLLGKFDLSWRLAKVMSKHSYPLWPILLELTPLLLPALLAYRERPRTFLRATVMVWPVAALALFLFSTTRFAATPIHAFQGITVPVSVLAVDGLRRLGFNRVPYRAVLATLLVAALTIPGMFWELRAAKNVVVFRPGDNNFITTSEHRALKYLARNRQPGGVITAVYLGEIVPGATGRRTYVGDCLWSQPHCAIRAAIVASLFQGNLKPAAARRFVLSERARFVLEDCRPTWAPLDKALAPILISVHRFGCARVYEVR